MKAQTTILSLKELEKACAGKLYYNGGPDGICGAVMDNRKLNKGDLFIAAPGERTDGHRFIDAAFEAGAACVISERELKEPKGSYILVPSSTQALRDIARYYRSKLEIPIVGITGSVGKTGTKEMVASVLSSRFNTHKTEGNFNNDLGLPLTLLGIRPWHEVAVVEMGISDFGEMDILADIAKPDLMVITNILECHLENLKDLDGVLRAKTEVLSHMKKGAHVFVNADNEKLRSLRTEGLNIHTFGLQNGKIRGRIIEDKVLEGSIIEITCDRGTFESEIHIAGEHNISHALAAASVGLCLGLSLDEIKTGISNASSVEGRSNTISLSDGILLIDSCYNASPAAMESSLVTLSRAKGRRIAVLGDMGELGSDEVALHERIADCPAFSDIDCVYTAGPLSGHIVSKLKENGYFGDAESFGDADSLTEKVLGVIKPNDVILVKASHFMKFDRVVSSIKNAFMAQD